MSSDHLDEKEIFKAAFALPAEERREYLEGVCQGDEDLLSRIETLLRQSEEDSRFLEVPPVPSTGDQFGEGIQSDVPLEIGPYKIREKIGEGGMGVVYVAEQTEPVQRKVALKVIKPGMDTKEVIARFEAERQALAFMEHPNIARVLDAGATDSGRSYFVMELVRGIPITEYCDQVQATPRERLALFQTVCDAVQHAHQKGIIHRDIKPSNVLVTQVSAKPVVKVIDFGLAKATSGQKLTDKTVYTGFMKLVGTPIYMSPEQAGLSGLDIDTRSDVYSLGVLLYELLTGTTPLDKTEIQKQAYDELCRQIREVEAPKPSSRISTLKDADRSTIAQQRGIEPKGLRQLLDGDLDVVVLKAIEKDRDRRYETPKELVADLDRFLTDQPVLAVPPSSFYLASKYFRRHRAAILTAAAFIAALVLATLFSSWQAIRANKAAVVAEDAKEKAVVSEQVATAALDREKLTAELRRRELYTANMQLADRIWHSPDGNQRKIEELLARWIPVHGLPDLREFSWRYQWSRLHQEASQTVFDTSDATFSPDGNLLTASGSGIREWTESGETQRWGGDASEATFSPRGLRAVIPRPDAIKLIDVSSGQTIREFSCERFAFSSNGQFLAGWGPEGEITVWDIETEPKVVEPLRSLGADINPDHGELALAPDGRSVLRKGILRAALPLKGLFAFLAGRDVPVTLSYFSPIGHCTWSPDGRLFAVGTLSGKIRLYRVAQPEQPIVFGTHGKQVTALTFSSDSQKLASGGSDGTIDVWDIASEPNTSTLVRSIKAHVESIRSIAFSPDGMELASTDVSGVAKRWQAQAVEGAVLVGDVAENPYVGTVGIEVAADGVTVAELHPGFPAAESGRIAKGDRLVGMSDDANSPILHVDDMHDRDIHELFFGRPGASVRLHFSQADGDRTVVELQYKRDEGFALGRTAFSPTGKSLSIASRSFGATNWNIREGRGTPYPFRGASVAYSPDGRFLAMDDMWQVAVWDRQNDRIHAKLTLRQGPLPKLELGASLAFSPDNKYLAAATGIPFNHQPKRSLLRVWNLDRLNESGGGEITIENGKPLYDNDHVLTAVAFTPDSKSVIAADHDGVVRIWNTNSWLLQEFPGFGRVTAMDLSPDGTTLALGFGASLSTSSGIVLWNVDKRQESKTLRGHRAIAVVFSPDGRTLASTSEKHDVVLWDVVTGRQLLTLSGHANFVFGAAFSHDGSELATTDVDGGLRLWKAATFARIDTHPLTLRSIFRLGVALNQEKRYADAVATLRHLLNLQQETLPGKSPEISKTRAEINSALAGLANLAKRRAPRDVGVP